MAQTKTVTYTAASLTSLSSLEISCERDEGRLGKIIKVERTRLESPDGEKAVTITYEKLILPHDVNLGNLIFKRFTSEVDKNLKVNEILLAGATPVLPGNNPSEQNSTAKVFIGNETLDILVYRDRNQT